MNCFTQIKNCFYLVLASLKIKDYIECTLKIFLKWLSKISDPFTSKPKVSNWWHLNIFLTGPHTFIAFTSWINQKNLVILDAIKASVPKFLNFLGAELDHLWVTQLEGKTLLLAENNDRNQIFKLINHLPKIRFKVFAWMMQKEFFCPEENTKPFNRNCATFYTKIFY